MDIWTWLATIPAGAVVSGVGVGAFIMAILTDRLMTRGQHIRRAQDLIDNHTREKKALEEHHAREVAAAKERLELVDESRKEWKAAAQAERERADKATDTVGEMAESQKNILHVLESLNQALREARNG